MDIKQTQENIKLSNALLQQSREYNGLAALTTMAAIASYVGAAVCIDQREQAGTIAFLAIGVLNNLVTAWAVAQSYKKSRAAMNALKHDINTKAK